MTGADARAQGRGRAGARGKDKGQGLWGRLRAVPARFMRPRLVLVATVAVLVTFGLVMIYSASSVSALSETGDALYYLERQLVFALLGLAVAVVAALVDYRTLCHRLLPAIWVVTVVLLVLVRLVGTTSGGATRWISIAGFQFQPSELAKVVIVLTFANLLERLVEEKSLSGRDFLIWTAVGVIVPLGLILVQPDKGSTLVLGLTLIVMAYLAGIDSKIVVCVLVVCVVGFFAYSVSDDYSRARLLAMLDPWDYYYSYGWQLIQGYYAFGSGGILGVGLGYSRQKYSYLPEAYNDFIYAVVGEELGLVGALAVLVAFGLVLWAGLSIAKEASDLSGRLVASGCTALLFVQFLLNVFGVLGLFPLSGKPIPFLSYGGSSLVASLGIVGLIVSVSRHSRLRETEHDRARRALSVEPGAGAGLSLVEGSTAGEPTPRSARGRGETGGAASWPTSGAGGETGGWPAGETGAAGEAGAGEAAGWPGAGEAGPHLVLHGYDLVGDAGSPAGLTLVDGGAAARDGRDGDGHDEGGRDEGGRDGGRAGRGRRGRGRGDDRERAGRGRGETSGRRGRDRDDQGRAGRDDDGLARGDGRAGRDGDTGLGSGRDRGRGGRAHGSSRPERGGARGDRDRGRDRSRGSDRDRGRGRDEAPRGRTTRDASGRERIDLGPTAAERLRRGDDGPTVR